jgi:hypothetical protein
VLAGVPGSAEACVGASATVLEAADVMLAQHVSAVMVVEEGVPVGILTTKDVLSRVVAKGSSAAFTCVSNVMTPNPDTAPPETTILDALHTMHRECWGGSLAFIFEFCSEYGNWLPTIRVPLFLFFGFVQRVDICTCRWLRSVGWWASWTSCC